MSIDWKETNRKLKSLTSSKAMLKKEIDKIKPEVETLKTRITVLEDSLKVFEEQYNEIHKEQEQLLSHIRRECNRAERAW